MAKRHIMISNMNKYIQLTVITTHLGGDLVSDILWGYTDAGVEILDVQDVIDLDKQGRAWDYVDESIFNGDKRVFVKACFPIDQAEESIKNIESELALLKQNSPFDLGSLETVKREIDGDLWREQWKEHFKPIPLGQITIVPEWIKYEKKGDEKVVYLDSNMAFGTGEHETTSMCVELLAEYVKPLDTVLDVGCGSGILGITASKLGAKKVLMTDIDECAVRSTEHNMKLNGITNGEVLLKNLLDDNSIKGDVIVANIMAEVLISFAPYLPQNLNKGGVIILSGILKDRLDKVKKAYLDAGFTYVKHTEKGEWTALVMRDSK